MTTCADTGLFVRGGGGGSRSTQEKPLTSFFSSFLVLNLFTEGVQRFISEKSIIFQGSRGGPTFSRGGGPTFSRGGVQPFPGGGGVVQYFIPYRNPYNLWLSRGYPLLWIRAWTSEGLREPAHPNSLNRVFIVSTHKIRYALSRWRLVYSKTTSTPHTHTYWV